MHFKRKFLRIIPKLRNKVLMHISGKVRWGVRMGREAVFD